MARLKRNIWKSALPYCAVIPLLGCSSPGTTNRTLRDATIVTAGSRFVLQLPGAAADAPRPTFTPWGFNYDRTVLDGRDVLLEDVLREQPEKIDRDFAAMRRLNGNVVRVFLATGYFLKGPQEIHPEAFAGLDLLLAAARRHDLRLILVGLANIRPADMPAWMRDADDETMDQAEGVFWQAVARHCRGNPAVFAYDLQNEPVIHWVDNDAWIVGCFDMPTGPKFCYCHYHYRRISRRWTAEIHRRFPDEAALRAHWPDYPRPGESWSSIAIPAFENKQDPRFGEYFAFQRPLLANWAARLAGIIRAEDPDHLITVGALNPPAVANVVDFHCFHLYPDPVPAGEDFLQTNARRWQERLSAITDGKPIILEEFYPLWVPAQIAKRDLLRTMLEATSPRATGWVSFYWGEPEIQTGSDPAGRELYAEWLRLWSEFAGGRIPPTS
ncbi:MAG TPA: hypothetical protein PKG54_16795 [Phycisphaerae bacterium]|nr:hypothetical protein [Phycisphaerae bacterium]HOB76173.1 hypothetical protein [Phycisphaerae bacterium]HOJ54588.1 hypothetical protein [Phycisphaerae bacterium]HOL27019.1 hypothetical protein [Phycisphaerae bacterium]HPP22799.1 hypothetical protein [Phycisphaerae bacterium]